MKRAQGPFLIPSDLRALERQHFEPAEQTEREGRNNHGVFDDSKFFSQFPSPPFSLLLSVSNRGQPPNLAMASTTPDQDTIRANWRCFIACGIITLCPIQYGLDFGLIGGLQAMVGFLKVSLFSLPR